jgi:hypothetical protein
VLACSSEIRPRRARPRLATGRAHSASSSLAAGRSRPRPPPRRACPCRSRPTEHTAAAEIRLSCGPWRPRSACRAARANGSCGCGGAGEKAAAAPLNGRMKVEEEEPPLSMESERLEDSDDDECTGCCCCSSRRRVRPWWSLSATEIRLPVRPTASETRGGRGERSPERSARRSREARWRGAARWSLEAGACDFDWDRFGGEAEVRTGPTCKDLGPHGRAFDGRKCRREVIS